MKRVLPLAVVLTLAPLPARGGEPAAGALRRQHVDGAGCSFQFAGRNAPRGDVFEWAFDGTRAWMHLDGADVALTVLSTKERNVRSGEPSIGDRRLMRLRGGRYRVTLDTRTTSECAADDEACEAWSEEGVITIRAGAASRVVKVTGLCGT